MTVNAPPLAEKPDVERTVRLPWVRSWPAPFTVVAAAGALAVVAVVSVTVALSAGLPVQPVMPLIVVPEAEV